MKVRQIISIVSLLSCVVSVYLLLQKPRPVAEPQAPAVVAANAQSFQYKLDQLERARARGQAETEVRLNSDEVNAAIAQAKTSMPATPGRQLTPTTATAETQSAPSGSGADEQPTVRDYQVNFEGDVVKGQFLVPIAGKDVWVTVAGHLGTKDGYATFDPTQFKVGEMNIPVSLVNEALQKKLSEQRDQLKLPEFIGDQKVENGELVMKEK